MKLVKGKGSAGEGACWMSAIQHYSTMGAGQWHDHPECVDPAIARLCITVNDRCKNDTEREAVIGGMLFLPVGTNEGVEMSLRRARWLALQVAHLWDCPDFVRRYLETGEGDVEQVCANAAYAATTAATTAAATAAANAAYATANAANAAYAAAAAAYAAATAANAAYAAAMPTIIGWIKELCSWSSKPELDAVQVKRTLKEACLDE